MNFLLVHSHILRQLLLFFLPDQLSVHGRDLLPVVLIRSCVALPSCSRGALTQHPGGTCRLHCLASSSSSPPCWTPHRTVGLGRPHLFSNHSFFPTLYCRAMACCQWPSKALCDVLLEFWVAGGPTPSLSFLLRCSDSSPSPRGGDRGRHFEAVVATVFCPGITVIKLHHTIVDHRASCFLVLGLNCFLTRSASVLGFGV